MFGEFAALLTALLWSVSAVFIGFAGSRVGSVVINRLRLLLALIFLLAIHWLLLGTLLPWQAEGERWGWLILSGIIGFALGDTLLFQAYSWLGPRLAMLLKSLAPVFSALLAWLFLGETLHGLQILGILLTVGGIAGVVTARNPTDRPPEADRHYLLGLLCGVGTALTQALGLILAKKGLGGDFSALSGNVIRMLGGAVSLWLVTLLQGQAGLTLRQLRHEKKAAGHIAIGTLLGSVLGVWFSLLAIQTTDVGIASTLMGLVPLFMLPIGYFLFHERFGWAVVAGTLITVAGVALLFTPR